MINSRPEHVPLPLGLLQFSNMGTPEVNSNLYCRIVGKFIFLTTTQLDLAFVMSMVSRSIAKREQSYLDAGKHILQQLLTLDYIILPLRILWYKDL